MSGVNKLYTYIWIGNTPTKLFAVEWKLRAWLCAVGWREFCPFGHEGSCPLLSIKVSTAVTAAAYIQA
jgi:hypothetical protein